MKMLDTFAYHIELHDNEYSAVRENFELKVQRITWMEHDTGFRFVPQVNNGVTMDLGHAPLTFG